MKQVVLFAAVLVSSACQKPSPEGTGAGASASAASALSGLLAVGSPAPDVEATAHTGERVRLGDFRGKPVVVYFYPKDDTPGCTVEAQGIRDQWPELQSTKAVVLGVSTDANDSHKAFAEKHQLPFLLLPDPDQGIARAFGVPVVAGHAKRVTFVIDAQGKVSRVFPAVDPKGHAQELLAALRSASD